MPLLISDFVIFTLDHLEKLHFRNISELNSGSTNLRTMIILGCGVALVSKHPGLGLPKASFQAKKYGRHLF